VHGRVIEAGLVAAVPKGDFEDWGPPFQHCEGVRLTSDVGRFAEVQIMRLEK
jgi:hypothetical protein